MYKRQANGCVSTCTTEVVVNDLPSVMATATCDVGDPTYTITATLDDGGDQLSSTVGTVSGTSPDFTVSNIPDGTPVTLTVTNSITGCRDTQLVSAPVCDCDATLPTMTIGDDVCGGGDVTVTAVASMVCDELRWYDAPTGGILLGTGSSLTQNITMTTNFYVACFDMDGDCESARVEVEAIVNLLPVVTLDPVNPSCIDDSSISLMGNPTGGLFSGDGVGGQMFSPVIAGEGTHTVTYNFTDDNGCMSLSLIHI